MYGWTLNPYNVNIMLRGISHTQNDKYYKISLIGDTYRVVKLIETETEWWLSGAERNREGRDLLFNG